MQPKVSILVPVYNVEQYLRQCMDSIVGQTLKEIEVVCVNDGSKDGSLEILKQYAANDDRIVIIDKENGGYGMAMNVASAKATGEYIGIVEPDDHIGKEMFEVLYSKAKEFDLDFVKADYHRFADDEQSGQPVYTLCKMTRENPDENYNVVFDPSESPRYLRYTMNTWAGIYKRSFLEENNIRYNETPGASYQDNGFWMQTFFFGKRAMIIDTPCYKYRIDNPNCSMKSVSKIYAINDEYDFIREVLMKHPQQWDNYKCGFWYGKYKGYVHTFSRITEEHKKDYTKFISKDLRKGYKDGELNDSMFNKLAWFNIRLLMTSPMAYYALHTTMSTKFMKQIKSHTYGKAK